MVPRNRSSPLSRRFLLRTLQSFSFPLLGNLLFNDITILKILIYCAILTEVIWKPSSELLTNCAKCKREREPFTPNFTTNPTTFCPRVFTVDQLLTFTIRAMDRVGMEMATSLAPYTLYKATNLGYYHTDTAKHLLSREK